MNSLLTGKAGEELGSIQPRSTYLDYNPQIHLIVPSAELVNS